MLVERQPINLAHEGVITTDGIKVCARHALRRAEEHEKKAQALREAVAVITAVPFGAPRRTEGVVVQRTPMTDARARETRIHDL